MWSSGAVTYRCHLPERGEDQQVAPVEGATEGATLTTVRADADCTGVTCSHTAGASVAGPSSVSDSDRLSG